MSNPFVNILSDSLLLKHKQGIEALIQKLEVPCQITYPITKYEDCPTCTNTLSGGSPNPFLGGNRGRFNTNINCPACGGSAKRPVITTEVIRLCVIWEPRKWKDLAGQLVFAPEGSVQTLSGLGTIKKIKGCASIIFDTEKEVYNKQEYRRDGEPQLAGFSNDFILTTWIIAG